MCRSQKTPVPYRFSSRNGAVIVLATLLFVLTPVGHILLAQQDLFDPVAPGLMAVRESSISIGDVDGDGNPDILITGEEDGFDATSTLYLGEGQGRFTRADAGLTAVKNGSSSIADVNGDQDEDLLITGSGTATLYLGDGQGAFSEAGAGLTGVESGSSSIADVDGDGNPDLLITGEDPDGNPTATLYLGDGQGGFSKASAGLAGVLNSSSSIADVDADGNPDLLITGEDTDGNRTATLYLGDGQGGFSEASAGLTGVDFGSSSIADVDGDANPDLLITGRNDNFAATATLYLGDGQGGFSEASTGLTGVENSSSSIADVDKDGDPDLLITGEDGDSDPTATLYLGDGQGGFTEAAAELNAVTEGSSAIADVSGDANPDLVITGEDADRNVTARLYLGDGNASFSTADPIQVRVARSSSSTGDVNGDGNLDLLITGQNPDLDETTTLYLGNGDLGFSEAGAGLTGVAGGSSSIDDVNNDGDLDLLITGEDANSDPTSTLYLGDGQGGFTEAGAGLTGVENSSSSIADVDGDGNPDLLITGLDANGTPTAMLYLGDGQGGFTTAGAGLTGVFNSASSIGDFNNDGNLDLVITGDKDPSGGSRNPEATLYLGDGQGGFTEASAELTGVVLATSSVGDVNEDGNLDLLLVGGGGFSIADGTLYLGDGQGGFTEAGADLTEVSGASSAIGDVNDDGHLDLVITGNETAALFLGDGDGGYTEAGTGLTGVDDGSSTFGDVDNDGHIDLLITGEKNFDEMAVLYENRSPGDLLVGTSSQSVSGDGTVDFGPTGADITFSGVSGSGEVVVQKFDNGSPGGTQGISETNVSDFRFVLSAGGDLRFDDDTEVRLDVGTLAGVGDPSSVSVFTRSVEGMGLFRVLQTTYDAGSGELVATTGSFSEFVLASDSSDNPLPVEMAGFEASVNQEEVRLTWQTVSETKNSGFEVQRRVREARASGTGTDAGEDGTAEWTKVGFVESNADGGSATEPQSYRFTDEDLPYEVDELSYRLRQVDLDGTESYSETVTVERGVRQLELLGSFPNPARGHTTIRFAVPDGQAVTLRIYDVLGREVRTLLREQTEGRHEQTIDLSGLPSGTYFLRLSTEEQTRTEKLTVMR